MRDFGGLFLRVEAHHQLGVLNGAGELGGDGLESPDVVVAEVVGLWVLDDQDSDLPEAVEDRDGEEGLLLFIVQAGDVFEVRVL